MRFKKCFGGFYTIEPYNYFIFSLMWKMEQGPHGQSQDSAVINKHHQSTSQLQFLANNQSSSWKKITANVATTL